MLTLMTAYRYDDVLKYFVNFTYWISMNPYQAPAAALDFDTIAQDAHAKFHVVSKRKLAIMLIGTMGGYMLYWFYKQWDTYRDSVSFDSTGGSIWPVMRAIFSYFYVHSLLSRVKEQGAEHPELVQWSNTSFATVLTLLLVVQSVIANAIGSFDTPLVNTLALVMLIPLAIMLAIAQGKINIVCGDPDGAANTGLTGANYAWLVLGLFVMAIWIVKIVAPEALAK